MSPDGFQVPGYVVEDLLGVGGGGQVWRARRTATGEVVALKQLRSSRDAAPAAAEQRLHREAALLREIRHPHLVRLHEVVPLPDGPVLVLDHAGGGSLAALLAARGRLSAGEVVTVAAPVAEALAAVHRRGVVHGDVSPANVLLTADGRPLLADLGVARLRGEPALDPQGTDAYADPAVLAGAPPTAASDVYGLAAVCVAALTGPSGDPPQDDEPAQRLLSALEGALDPDPHARPTAGELAVRLYDATEPRPLSRLVAAPRPGPSGGRAPGRAGAPEHEAAPSGPAGSARPASAGADGEAGAGDVTHRLRAAARAQTGSPAVPGRRTARRGRWMGLGAVGVVGVVGMLLLGWLAVGLVAGGGAAPAAPTAVPVRGVESSSAATPAPRVESGEDWALVLATLYATRAQAFATADPAPLRRVYAPDSPALEANEAMVRSLAERGARAPDVRLLVHDVRALRVGADRARLRVVDELAPFTVTRGGQRWPGVGRGVQTVDVLLARSSSGNWQIVDTRPVGGR